MLNGSITNNFVAFDFPWCKKHNNLSSLWIVTVYRVYNVPFSIIIIFTWMKIVVCFDILIMHQWASGSVVNLMQIQRKKLLCAHRSVYLSTNRSELFRRCVPYKYGIRVQILRWPICILSILFHYVGHFFDRTSDFE